jgi:hypothetical protein
MTIEHRTRNDTIALDDWDAPDEGPAFEEEHHNTEHLAAVKKKMQELRKIYIETERDDVLRMQFETLLEEREAGAPIRDYSGLLVKASSGAGKSTMLRDFLRHHPAVHDFGRERSDFIHIDVPSPVNNKTLGLEVLRCMYPQQRGNAPSNSKDIALSDIWVETRNMAAELGVWGLWIDEAHDLANGGHHMMKVMRSSFKRWMAHEHRPILILSGTPEIEDIFETRELRRRFLLVESPTLSADTDLPELRRMIATYLRAAELGIHSSLGEFMPRLVHAGTKQIGWTINVVLEAIREALMERSSVLSVEHFAASYGRLIRAEPRNNPFIADDWSRIDTVLHRSTIDEQGKQKRRSRKREDGPW